jgi:hypothetical protein
MEKGRVIVKRVSPFLSIASSISIGSKYKPYTNSHPEVLIRVLNVLISGPVKSKTTITMQLSHQQLISSSKLQGECEGKAQGGTFAADLVRPGGEDVVVLRP